MSESPYVYVRKEVREKLRVVKEELSKELGYDVSYGDAIAFLIKSFFETKEGRER